MANTSSDNVKNEKIALTIGINEYQDSDIRRLSGAENDARELFELLSSKPNGFVEDKNRYLLLGARATQRNILKQISEIFRQDESFDLALFYFSGHGFVDKNKHLYLSTYDTDKKDPYVCGIKVDDLSNQIYSSKNTRSAIIILDCCYSGTATAKTTKVKNIKPIIEKNFNFNKVNKKKYGAGKFTITSCAKDMESWERQNCIHSKEDTPHEHGAFTYYLLEGLRGGAAHPTTGEITLTNLQDWIQQQVPKGSEQEPYLAASEATNTNAIRIAFSTSQYKKYISDIENDLETDFPEEDPDFPSILYIIVGAKKLQELKDKDSSNPKIPIFHERISRRLEKYKSEVIIWCDKLPEDIKIQLGQQTGTKDVVYLFTETVASLEIDIISTVGENLTPILDLMGNKVKYNATFKKNINDPTVTAFLTRFASVYAGFPSNNGTNG
jgi:uncharacterized caspase-like protein